MPNWKEVMDEIQLEAANGAKYAIDVVRHRYFAKIHEKTGRNIIAYYSGWLQRGTVPDTIINDKDKNGIMLCVHRMDRSKGLDLILHTPGGNLGATESIVAYLQAMFGEDIRAIIPQISMSAGTMIALSCKEIIMGKQSNLGPIDPQMGGVACQAVLKEFQQALEDIKNNPASAPLWQTIISKYHPTFLLSCKQSIEWSEKLVEEWLLCNMCKDNNETAQKILKGFSDHTENKAHDRHISTKKCKELGVSVIDMEDDNELQDLILTVHHAFMHTFNNSTNTKIIENHMHTTYAEALPIA